MQRDFERGAKNSATSMSKAFGREMPKVEKAIDKATAASGRFLVEQQKLDAMLKKGNATAEQRIRQSERVATAYRNESNALREVAQAMSKMGDGSSTATAGVMGLGAAVRGLSSAATPMAVTGLAVGIGQLTAAASAASGAIGMLPGAIGGAVTAFGTLKLATLGFSDALESVNDAEKFAEALRKLSPQARQAALSIQAMMPAFNQLKNATQDALFANVGPQLEKFTNTLLPSVRQATTGISSAFNQMFMGATNQLMTPQTMASLQTFSNNIVNTFQQLTPAIAPLTQAFAELTAASTSVLPGIAQGAANAAQSFADFINEASRSGELQDWITDGLDAVKQLWPVVESLTKAFMDLRPVGQEVLPTIVSGIEAIAEKLPGAVQLATDLTDPFFKTAGAVEFLGDVVGKVFPDLEQHIQNALNPLKAIVDTVQAVGNLLGFDMGGATASAVDNAQRSLDEALGKAERYGPGAVRPGQRTNPLLPIMDPSGALTPPQQGGWGQRGQAGPPLSILPGAGAGAPAGASPFGPAAPGGPGARPMPPNVGGIGSGASSIAQGSSDAQSQGSWGPRGGIFADPSARAGGPKESESERRDRIRAGMNPDQFAVDPFSGLPTLAPEYNQGPGGYVVDPQQVTEAQQRAQSEAWDVQEARLDLAVLEQDTLASEAERIAARRKLQEEEWDLSNAQYDLAEAQRGTWEKLNDTATDFKNGMQDIGAALDQDFGLSEGLPGLAKNLTMFLANLAAAPLLGQLAAVRMGAEAQGQPTGGFGLLGILGAQNIMQGKSPILGRPLSGGYDPINATYTPGAPIGPVGAPTILQDTGSTPSGPQSRTAAALIEQYFGGALRGPIGGSRDTGTAPGTHDAGLSIDIPIGPDQKELGDQIESFLRNNAAALGLEYTIWRDTWKDMAGNVSPQSGHQDHIDAHFNGSGGSGAFSMPGMPQYGQPSSSSFGGIPIPLPVTIVGGGGGASPSNLGPAALQPKMPGMPGAGGATPFGNFGAPGSKQAIANMIYQQAISRGYSPHEATSIVAYAIGESGLNPSISGGAQGGAGSSNEVIGLFQQKPAFAEGGGIDPSQRSDPVANTWAYLNQLEKNRHLPIEQALPRTSVGGPLASGPGSAPQNWENLYGQAQSLLGGGGWGGPGLPSSAPAGEGVGFGQKVGAGAGAGQGILPQQHGATGGAAPGPNSVMPGKQPSANQAGAPGPGLGGLPMEGINTAISAAGLALDAMAPGAGQAAAAAAQTGVKLINRSIQYGGQLAAIGASGLMETFMLSGGVDPMKSLPGRLIAGFAGARPAIPNSAGQQSQGQTGPQPGGVQPQPGQNGGVNFNVQNMNVGSKDDGKKVSQDATKGFASAQASGWFGQR